MYAMVVRFEDGPQDLEDGISHVQEEVLPIAQSTPGVAGFWLVDRDSGERLSVMVFDDESRAEAVFGAVGERRAADPDRNRPSPVGSKRYEVYGIAGITREGSTHGG
jgi:hypothetical protein